jgi:protein involved in polysaccharide export with SLBB domain
MTALRMFMIAALALCVGLPAAAEGYKVNTNDLLRLRVLGWDPIDGVVTEWPTISESYKVGQSGEISVPLIGDLMVKGLTTTEIARAVEGGLKQRLALSQPPEAAVDIEEYAPIFLGGQVDKPGPYEYAPGMTVLKATNLAGGPFRAENGSGQGRNYHTALGAASSVQDALLRLKVRRARLQAEMNESTSLANGLSDLSPSEEELEQVVAREEAIMQSRTARHEFEIESLKNAEEVLSQGLSTLENKLEISQKQFEAGKTELVKAQGLASKGLKTTSSVFDRERYVGDLESRVLDIERAVLDASQALSAKERERTLLSAKREEDISTELQEVEAEIAEAEQQLATQTALLAEAIGAGAIESKPDAASWRLSYRITRTNGGKATQIVISGCVLHSR